MKLNVRYNNLLDIINLNFGVYNPLREFVSRDDFLSIVKRNRLVNNKFFPLPIFIDISSTSYNRLKTNKIIKTFFRSQKICDLKIKSFYKLNKIEIGEILFRTKDVNHPGFRQFLNSGDYFIQCKIENFNYQIMKSLDFTYPLKLKSIISKYGFKTVAGFHTRNVPHRAHEWIHTHGLKKCDGLLIQPIIGQFKKKEYKAKSIIQGNLKLVNQIYKIKNVFFALFYS